jgi:hypothetical protein
LFGRYAALILVALLGAHTASAQCDDATARNGWVLLQYTPSSSAGVTGYRFRAGQVPGVWTITRDSLQPISNRYCFDGLTSTGAWYFVASSLIVGGEGTNRSNIACFTMSGAACLPGPWETDVSAVSFREPVVTPPTTSRASITVNVVVWNAELGYSTSVQGTGVSTLCYELQGGAVLDDMRRAGATTPDLGINNDTKSAAAACISTPVLPIEASGDIDGVLTGISVRVNGTLYPLITEGGSRTAFPWALTRRIVQ